MCLAMKKATSSESLSETASAFFKMIATRISCSGGSIATVRPQEKTRFEAFVDSRKIFRIRIAGDNELLVASINALNA